METTIETDQSVLAVQNNAESSATGRSIPRRNYSLKLKMDVISEYVPSSRGAGFIALAKKHNVPHSAIRGWWDNREELRKTLKNPQILTRKSRRLEGGGRKAWFVELEKELHAWIVARNVKGLQVKDHYMRLMALKIWERRRGSGDATDEISFKASTGWLDRFKTRHNLVSRRHTTTRKLPENATEICRDFIQECHELIDLHKIKPRNIINMDQVPRYYESEPKSTITTRGSKQVLMTKGGTSHKRFIAGFTITGEGKHLAPHILISKRTTTPRVAQGCFVDVNNTGMWNEKICFAHFEETVLKRYYSKFLREPTLYLIDSYGSHLNWPGKHGKTLEDHNVFMRLVPPNLTSILQPLDVAINRSYQNDYGIKYDSYLAEALGNPQMQTRHGNPKIPTPKLVSEWMLEWIKSCTPKMIANEFKVCGLVPSTEFEVKDLHPPLRALFADEVDMGQWAETWGDLLNESDEIRDVLIMDSPDWFCPQQEHSLFRCILHMKGIRDEAVGDVLSAYVLEVALHMHGLPDLADIFDEDEEADLVSGEVAAGTLAVFGACDLEGWEITLTDVNLDMKVMSSFVYSVDSPDKKIHLARFEDYFSVLVAAD